MWRTFVIGLAVALRVSGREMLGELYNYFFGDEKPEEYKKRLAYLQTVSKYELIEASLPVFVAAGVSGSAIAIIDVLGEESEDDKLIMISLYGLFAYVVGKCLTYVLLLDEERKWNSFPYPLLRKYKFSKLFRHSLSELSGFAWKEFFIALCLEKIYMEEGLGPAFGSWLLIVGISIVAVTISSHVQRSIFRLNEVWNQKVLSYDTEAFALSMAYILTTVLALACWKGGIALVPSNSILFEWYDDFEEHHSAGVQVVYLYSFLLACGVSYIQFEEGEESAVMGDELCEVRQSQLAPTVHPSALQQAVAVANAARAGAGAGETVNPIASVSTQNSFELDARQSSAGWYGPEPSMAAAPTPPGSPTSLWRRIFDRDSMLTFKILYNEFLGYFAGLSYLLFILTISTFISPYKIIPALVIAVFLAYRGPYIIAKLRIKTEEALAKRQLEATNQAQDTAVAGADTETDRAPQTTAQSAAPKPEGWCCCVQEVDNPFLRWVKRLEEQWEDVSLRRKGVMMVSIRLTVGWLWEIVVADAFELLSDTGALEPYQVVLVEILFATVIIAIVLGVHLYVRDWASDALIAEDARTLNANTTQPVARQEERGQEEGGSFVEASFGHSSTITV